MLRSRSPIAKARPPKIAVGSRVSLLFSLLFVLAAGDIQIARYLAKYSYLPTSDLETNQLRSSDEIEQAIRDLQFMGGLNETGHIDEKTVDLIKTERCGLADHVNLLRARSAAAVLSQQHPASAAGRTAVRRRLRRFAQSGSRWPKNTISWTVTEYTGLLSEGETRRVLKSAFEVWGAVAPLAFREVAPDPSTNSAHADIRIKFAERNHGDGFPFDGKGGTLAHAFYPGQSDIDGDTHFDNEEKWVASYTQEGTHLPFVAVHEFGHALGLMHTSVKGSIMYPWYKKPRDTDIIMLQTDDIDGITAIYGSRTGIRPTAPLPTRPSPPPPPTRPVTSPRLPIPASTTVRPSRASTKQPPTDGIPWQCKTKFDAVTRIRQEIMSFKGKSMWRMKKGGAPAYLNVIDTGSFFVGLPPASTWTKIDEVFELSNNDIVFFIGRRYFLFDGTKLKGGFPTQGKPITDFGLPASLDNVDAMFRWGLNRMTYIISGNMYWKYDETEKRMFPDYPRDMSMWRGVQLPVDAVFQSFNGKTYFFSGLQYWEFDDNRMSVVLGYPKWANMAWLGCPPPGLTEHHASHSYAQRVYLSYWWTTVFALLLLIIS